MTPLLPLLLLLYKARESKRVVAEKKRPAA